MNPRYIVVEGAIGSGKTALSRRLAEHFSALLLSENSDHNPFLMKFYSNVSNNGLAAELFFLTRRAESVNIIEDQCAQGGMVVADFLPEKDRIFTPIVLNDDEQQLFADMKQRILPQYAEPDVVFICKPPSKTTANVCKNVKRVSSACFPKAIWDGCMTNTAISSICIKARLY